MAGEDVNIPNVIKSPFLSIQCDWNEVLRIKDGTAWVSCKVRDSDTKHGKLKCVEFPSKVVASDKFVISSISPSLIVLGCEDPKCACTFVAAEKEFRSTHSKSIISLDVTPNGLGVSVCSDNKLLVWDTRNGSVLRTLEGHVWDVYNCRFFPSGLVVLSAGADMQIKIWSAENGSCPVTLTGHTAAITDTAIVDRGRNIVSVSKDGSARLWDCGKSTCLSTIVSKKDTINSCALKKVGLDLGQPAEPPGEREISTENKLLLLGCKSGSICGVGLHSRKQIFEVKAESGVNCCCFVSETKAVCGCEDGKISVIDFSKTCRISTVWEDSSSPVLCLLPVVNGVFAGRADGTCGFVSLDNDKIMQLTGPEFDPVYCMASDRISIYTGSRDGKIRKYTLPSSLNISVV